MLANQLKGGEEELIWGLVEEEEVEVGEGWRGGSQGGREGGREGGDGGGVQRWSDMWLRLLSFLSQCQGIDTVIHPPTSPQHTHTPSHPPSQCCRDNVCRGDAYWHNAATILRALKHLSHTHTLRERAEQATEKEKKRREGIKRKKGGREG